MAALAILKVTNSILPRNLFGARLLHETSPLCAIQAGKYKPTKNRSRPLTYEQANPPTEIAHRKSWNSWNTSTIEIGQRTAATALEDMFIRKFLMGTFQRKIMSEIIIKRQHNIIRIAFIIIRRLTPSQTAFLSGYTEEMLGYWLQAPVKLELQFIENASDIVFKYI